MNRRDSLIMLGLSISTMIVADRKNLAYATEPEGVSDTPLKQRSLSDIRVALQQLQREPTKIDAVELTDRQWRQLLTESEYLILRKEMTEKPFTSALNDEQRNGRFVCAGCGLALFSSAMKYDSGTGWPSFSAVLTGRVNTKLDFGFGLPRTEYHCARCGGHQGHVFKDGPQPSGLRYCNNGLALSFVAEQA